MFKSPETSERRRWKRVASHMGVLGTGTACHDCCALVPSAAQEWTCLGPV